MAIGDGGKKSGCSVYQVDEYGKGKWTQISVQNSHCSR